VIANSIDRVAASRDASVLIVSTGTVVSLYRAYSNELLAQFVGDFDILSAEFTPDSRWIVVIGNNQIMFQQVSGGCSRHSHKFESSIMAIASASGRLAVVNFTVDDNGKGSTKIYASGDAGYSSLSLAQGTLTSILTR
jgi:hypothetical protein